VLITLYGWGDLWHTPYIGDGTPPPLRMPPIYDILTGKKGGQSLKQSIRKKNSGKNLGNFKCFYYLCFMSKKTKYPKDNGFLFEIASRYETQKEFRINDPKHYKVCYRRGLLKEMFPNNNSILHRDIYSFVFEQTKTIYIGLTCNIKRRFKEHLKKSYSPVFRYIQETNQKYEFKVLTESPLMSEDAAKKECELIDKFLSEGWILLNSNSGGNLGSSIKIWNYENLHEESLKYKTKVDFRKYNPNAYHASTRLGVTDKICSHMVKLYPNWDDEDLFSEAKKYITINDFRKNSINAYNQSRRRGLLKEVCSHMKSPYIKWSNDKLSIEAKKYNTRSEFIKNCPGGYGSARDRGILDDICSHMKIKPSWTTESMIETAKKYDSIQKLRNDNVYVYRKLLKLGILSEIYAST
jgi:predicted GIY-YIG superfamily endonuclease